MIPDIEVIEIPCGKGSLNQLDEVSEYPIEDLLDADGVVVESNTWRKEGGATKINTTVITGAPSVMGLWDFWPAAGTQKRIAACGDGAIYSIVTAGIGDTLVSGLGANKQTTFCEALGAASTRKLFMFNGYDAPQVTSDGVTAAALATPPADWSAHNQPTVGVFHNGRVWGFGNANALHRIYYSTLTNHEDFTGAGSGSLNCYPGEGERLIAGWSFAGRLYLWKFPKGIYWIDDSSTDVANWKCQRLSLSVGMAGPLGLCQIDNDVLFISTQGLVHALSTVQEYGDAKSSAILPEKIGPFLRDKILFSSLSKAVAIYYANKKQWILQFCATGYTTNNYRLYLDLNIMENPRYSYSTRDIAEAMTITRDSVGLEKPMTGDNAGFLWLLDQGTRSKQGAGYMAKYETGDVALYPGGARRGNLQWIEIAFQPKGTHYLNLEIYRDGVVSETVQISMGSGGSALDSGALGNFILGGGNIINTRKKIRGACKRIRVKGYAGGIAEDFSIGSHMIGFLPGTQGNK